jgi:hypothetical protein
MARDIVNHSLPIKNKEKEKPTYFPALLLLSMFGVNILICIFHLHINRLIQKLVKKLNEQPVLLSRKRE